MKVCTTAESVLSVLQSQSSILCLMVTPLFLFLSTGVFLGIHETLSWK